MGAALARGQEGSVLLTDLDLNSGLLRFLLRLTNDRSVVDAVENAHEIDETNWPQMVSAKSMMRQRRQNKPSRAIRGAGRDWPDKSRSVDRFRAAQGNVLPTNFSLKSLTISPI
jgi:hypothetical protein